MLSKNVNNTSAASGAIPLKSESKTADTAIGPVPKKQKLSNGDHPHLSSLSSQPPLPGSTSMRPRSSVRPDGTHLLESPNFPNVNQSPEAADSRSSTDSSTAMGLINIVPPLLIERTSIEAGENIDWNNSSKISPDHIEGIRQRISKSFPETEKPQYSWQSPTSPYPEEDLEKSLSFYPKNHSYAKYSDKNITERYNPYSFKMPYALQSFDHWVDGSNVFSAYDEQQRGGYMPPGKIKEKDAKTQYLNFIKEYHLLYVDLLEAAAGSQESVNRIKNKIHTNELYERAGIDPKYLKKSYSSNNASDEFRYGMLVQMSIDALVSSDPALSTAARAQILSVLHQNFDPEKLATSFEKNSLGFKLPYSVKDEPVEDLIPRAFMKRPEEKGGTPHNELFLKNEKIQDIFQIRPGYGILSERMNFDAGLSVLLNQHPKETVQTLLSLMRIPQTGREIQKLALHALLNLSQLDPAQKGDLFGIKASYRTDIQNQNQSGFQSRVGGTTGVGAGFGHDGLDGLSADQLRTRLRQAHAYMNLLEEKLAANASVAGATQTHETSFSDPKNYLKILGLSPSVQEEDFEILLTACYRTLARKMHPDKGGDTEKFKELQNAYEVLSDPEKRFNYLNEFN